MNTSKATIPVLILLLPLMFLSCSMDTGNPAEDRAARAESAKGDIVIGAASAWESLPFMMWEGIDMAVQEVNSSGGIRGRKIKIIKKDDQASVNEGILVAQSFADTPDMVAVIGHYNSYISIPTSIVYSYYGLVMISPWSTNPKFTSQGFKRVFRNIPNDVHFGFSMADFCKKNKLERVMIYYVEDDYGVGLANSFEIAAEESDIMVPDRMGYNSVSGQRNFTDNLKYWKENFKFDAIFIADVLPRAAICIREARSLGIDVPFLGGDGLDSKDLIRIIGKEHADNVYMPCVFNPSADNPQTREYVTNFKKKYGRTPDTHSALGYDAVKLLAHAMDKSGSTVPTEVARTLHGLKKYKGVTGHYTFDKNGDVVDKQLFIKALIKGEFKIISD